MRGRHVRTPEERARIPQSLREAWARRRRIEVKDVERQVELAKEPPRPRPENTTPDTFWAEFGRMYLRRGL